MTLFACIDNRSLSFARILDKHFNWNEMQQRYNYMKRLMKNEIYANIHFC